MHGENSYESDPERLGCSGLVEYKRKGRDSVFAATTEDEPTRGPKEKIMRDETYEKK